MPAVSALPFVYRGTSGGVKPLEEEMTRVRYLLIIAVALLLPSCATWSTADVDLAPGTEQPSQAVAEKTDPAKIIVMQDDITDRSYRVIGDIEVTVNKTTLFHPDPTPELVDQKLRDKAAELGADAVILVRYGTVGVSFVSWGSLDGKGRAIKFEN